VNGEEKNIVERELDLLDTQYGILREVARETMDSLGEEATGYWVDAHNTCIDLVPAISRHYPRETLTRHLLLYRFWELYKELPWLRFLFLVGNYPVVARELRFTWEAFSQAYVVDVRFPRFDIESKIKRLNKKEYRGWRVIPKALEMMPSSIGEKQDWRGMYDTLSLIAHPTRTELDLKLLRAEGAPLVTDVFEEETASGLFIAAKMIFDKVWTIAFFRYPDIAPSLSQVSGFVQHLKDFCPFAYLHLRLLVGRQEL